MNLDEVLKLIDTYYKKPVLRKYTLTENDLKYKFHNLVTQKSRAKADAFKAKEDAKLLAEWTRDLKKYNYVQDVVRSAAEYPKAVSDLFYMTFELTISGIGNRHTDYLSKVEAFKTDFGPNAWNAYNIVKYSLRPSYGYSSRSLSKFVDLTEKWWNDTVDAYRGDFIKNETTGKYEYTYPLREFSNNWLEFAQRCQAVLESYEMDDISKNGETAAYASAIEHLSDTLGRVMADIKSAFNGNIPDKCEPDIRWGIDGRFNAILSYGTDRVSFCSFSAGRHISGVQRYHFRAKVTHLK